MTQAINLANFSNNLDTSGNVTPNVLNAPVPLNRGGTASTTAAGARTALGAAVVGANNDITSLTALSTAITVAQGGTNATTAAAARSNLGLVIGTDVLAPGGTGAGLINLNASSISSGVVPVQNSGALKLISRTQIYTSSATGVITTTVPTSIFGGVTPSFVMYSATAAGGGGTDLRYYFVTSSTDGNTANIVLGCSSDDTDQNGQASLYTSSMYVLPYSATQQYLVTQYLGPTITLTINVIGYQY